MSASTEQLVEQIRLTEQAIATAESSGQDSSTLKADLKRFQRRLQASNEALTEGRQILKG